jgi:hypothetical protein
MNYVKDKFMGNKIGAIFIILLVIVLIGAFILYVYMFSGSTGKSNVEIVVPAQIQGISIGRQSSGNFRLPEDAPYENSDLLSKNIETRIENADDVSGKYALSIEKIGVANESISHTKDLEFLKNDGWMLLPWSYHKESKPFSFLPWVKENDRNEPIIVCYRRFFGETHPKSCINLHQLEKGDAINFDDTNYIVENVVRADRVLETIFDSSKGDYLKIISSTGKNIFQTDGDEGYIVVIAKKSV